MDDSFLTGCALVDSQHGQLFEAINRLLDDCERGEAGTELKAALDFLNDYTIKHFFDEEKILAKYGFSGLKSHQVFHETFKKKVAELAHEFIFKGVSDKLIQAVQDKIGTWLVDHIKGQDFRWTSELKQTAPELFTAEGARAHPVAGVRIGAAAAKPAVPAPGKPPASGGQASPAQEKPPAPGPGDKAPPASSPGKGRFAGLRFRFLFLAALLFLADLALAFSFALPSLGGRLSAAALAAVAAVTILLPVLSRGILRPLGQISLALEGLARGDLGQVIPAGKGEDELSRMTRTLARAQEGIRGLAASVGEKARALSRVAEELQDLAKNSEPVIDGINHHTLEMQSKSSSQAEGVARTNAAMGKIILNIEGLNGHIEEQAESISRSSASVEEMISNISSITASLTRNEQDLMKLREASSQGNASLQKVSGDIQEVSRESERLLEINKVIQNIASQTNLLAMNAAIEAAHAGEVGRGFAVVADEIRKLAESSSQQAKTVSGVLKNIKDALGGISSATIASLRQFEDIDRGFEAVSTQGREVRAAMEQQDGGNKEILKSMESVNGIAQNVRNSSQEINNGSREAAVEGKNLEAETGEVTGAIDRIASGLDEINSAISRTAEISRRNRQDLDALLGEIARFRI